MDVTTYYEMLQFANRFLSKDRENKILDVGSKDVNGAFKPIFDKPNWSYTGIDIEPGMNVDIVTEQAYHYPMDDDSYDVIVSGSCLEHVPNLTAICLEMNRVLKPDGIVCLIAPYTSLMHSHPVDCWRIYPDGMMFLLVNVMKRQLVALGMSGDHTVGVAGIPQ
jgi:ubiquinone/menaquinone biosynthesis C-methylase UbiE